MSPVSRATSAAGGLRHTTSLGRILVLFRAFLARQGAADSVLSTLVLPTVLVAGFAGLVQGELTGFAHALVFLTLAAMFVAIPLLGDLGYLLRSDPASEWVGALPATEREVRVAGALHLLAALVVLVCGPLLPALLLVPEGFGIADRLLLLAGGMGVALVLSALLLTAQALFAGRAESLFVLLQTGLVAGVFLGIVLGARHISVVRGLTGLDPTSALVLLPSAWFAIPFGEGGSPLVPLVCIAVALPAILFLPRTHAPPSSDRPSLVERLLAPARAAATRLWVAADERAPFDLVYDALPREREVVLRTYPMIGIPLAFLIAASSGEATTAREGLLALLLFTPGIYLPILLTHVPASESHEASWLCATAPVTPGAVANGSIKALAVRFLLPLYALLFVIAWASAGPVLAIRLALPGGLVSLLVLRRLYLGVVNDPPLSVAPDRIQTRLDWSGGLFAMAMFLTLAAVGAALFLDLPLALGAALLLAGLEIALGRALRRRLG